MSASDYIHLDFDEIVHETDKALLVRLAGDKGEHWIPLSLITDSGDYRAGDKDGSLSVPEWFARREHLLP